MKVPNLPTTMRTRDSSRTWRLSIFTFPLRVRIGLLIKLVAAAGTTLEQRLARSRQNDLMSQFKLYSVWYPLSDGCSNALLSPSREILDLVRRKQAQPKIGLLTAEGGCRHTQGQFQRKGKHLQLSSEPQSSGTLASVKVPLTVTKTKPSCLTQYQIVVAGITPSGLSTYMAQGP
ncbi:hypothetical protein BR93DRAFT_280616 [Coniochaeta sp. PMI_546]|nr:hypothetical protein BR93DRAFT_280616 [Coniochaeta sp. PMI_546]